MMKAKIQKSSEWWDNFVSGNNPVYEVDKIEELVFLMKKFKFPILIKEPHNPNISDIDVEIFDEYRIK